MDRQEIVAYLAGIFEGEGSIMIAKSPPHGRGKSPNHRLMVVMTSTNWEVLQLAEKLYGGRVNGPFVRGERWRPSYRWELDGENSLSFLSDIEPYIQTKRDQIRIAYEFQEQIRNCRTISLGKGRGSKPMSDEEIEVRESFYQKMKSLNQRGTHPDE